MLKKCDELRLNAQAFWLFSTTMIFVFSELLGMRLLLLGWIAFLILVVLACVALAVMAVRASRRMGERGSVKSLGQFAKIFDGYIAIIPFFGLFVHRYEPVQKLSDELAQRRLKACERKIVAQYARG
ncbi:MAG TPA: hypothetical protein VN420_05315 [Candidatus Fimivivens sp.]|nr:hypothetical protein [Candidatus Fimivivens sp.]